MGCDIHIYAEKFDGQRWHKLPVAVPDDRNYWAFAFLADVRNGHGFAGYDTGDAVTPIAAPRGIPADTSIHNNDIQYPHPDYVWLGDHSFSWLTLAELRAFDLNTPVRVRGMITEKAAAALDEHGTFPDSWCSWTNDTSFVQRSWVRPAREAASLIPSILETFKAETEPETVRLVFGFDS